MSRRQYIGARYVPKYFDWDGSNEWKSGVTYEALTIVTRNGNNYTSKIPVPSNVGEPENNPEYWVLTGMSDEQIESLRQDLTVAQGDINELKEDLSESVGDLKNAFEDFTDQVADSESIYSANLLKPDSEQGYWDVTTGAAVDTPGYSRTTNFISVPVTGSTRKVYVTAKNSVFPTDGLFLIEYDDGATPINYSRHTSDTNFNLKTATTRIKVYINGTNVTMADMCVSMTSTVYVPYSVTNEYTIKLDALPNEINEQIESITDVLDYQYEDTTDYYESSATYTGRNVYYIDSTHAYLKQETNYTVKEFSLKAGDTYSISGSGNPNTSDRKYLFVTTATKFPVPTGTYGTAVAPIDYHILQGNTEIVNYTPAVDCYLYVQQNDLEQHIFVRGPVRKLKIDMLSEQTLPLSGKKIVNFGDSIFGNYRDTFGGNMSISAMIANRTGATVYNAGFGGCRMKKSDDHGVWKWFSMEALADAIATGVWTEQDAALIEGAGTLLSYFGDTVTMLKGITWSEIDVITIGYGTNDFSGNVTEQDFKNALDYSIETILTAYPKIKIYVVSPMFRWWSASDGSDTHTNANSDTLVDFVTYCKEESDKYHVGYIDTYTNLGINLINRLNYFPSTDGTHPNVDGRNARAYKMIGVLLTQ